MCACELNRVQLFGGTLKVPLSVGFSRQEYWSGLPCHALLQGIFPVQGSNPGLLHYRQILYHLSHLGSPESLGEL